MIEITEYCSTCKQERLRILRLSLLFIATSIFLSTFFGCAGVTGNFETREFTLPSMQIKIVDSSSKMPYNCAGNNAVGCMSRHKGLITLHLRAHMQDGKFYPNEWAIGHEPWEVLHMLYPDWFPDPDRLGKFGFGD